MVTSDISSWGTDRRTDTVLESSYENMSAHKKFQLIILTNERILVDLALISYIVATRYLVSRDM